MTTTERKKTIDITEGDVLVGDYVVLVNGSPKRAGYTITDVRLKRGGESVEYTTPQGVRTVKVGDSLRVQRPMTADEIEAADAERDRELVAEVRRLVDGAEARIAKVRDFFIEKLTTSYANDPARAIHWHGSAVSESQGEEACWVACGRAALHFASQEGHAVPDDRHVIEGVVAIVKETRRDLLTYYGANRSTSVFSNAVEDAQRVGRSHWLRGHGVHSALLVAARMGIDVEGEA